MVFSLSYCLEVIGLEIDDGQVADQHSLVGKCIHYILSWLRIQIEIVCSLTEAVCQAINPCCNPMVNEGRQVALVLLKTFVTFWFSWGIIPAGQPFSLDRL